MAVITAVTAGFLWYLLPCHCLLFILTHWHCQNDVWLMLWSCRHYWCHD